MALMNTAYSHQSGGVRLLLWTCSGIPPGYSSTVKHYMPAAVHTLHRQPCLEIVKAGEEGFGKFQEGIG
jgi:hypothetical protein